MEWLYQYYNTTWILTNLIEKKLDMKWTRMVYATLKSSGSDTPQNICRTTTYISSKKHPRKSNKHIIGVLLWIPTHRSARVNRPGRFYLHQLCVDIEGSLENLLGPMDDKEQRETETVTQGDRETRTSLLLSN